MAQFRAVIQGQRGSASRLGSKRSGMSASVDGQRRSASQYSGQRRINAVCWHGYRDVLIEIFQINPDAKVRTALAKYLGRDNFYEQFPRTAYHNVGSLIHPAYMPDLCECER